MSAGNPEGLIGRGREVRIPCRGCYRSHQSLSPATVDAGEWGVDHGGERMRHYLLLGDERQVLGVWEAPDDVAAARFVLKLSLAYPECTTVVDRASDFESFKAGHGDFDFDGIEPEPVSV